VDVFAAQIGEGESSRCLQKRFAKEASPRVSKDGDSSRSLVCLSPLNNVVGHSLAPNGISEALLRHRE
jgi:hypothetical protein